MVLCVRRIQMTIVTMVYKSSPNTNHMKKKRRKISYIFTRPTYKKTTSSKEAVIHDNKKHNPYNAGLH